MRLFVAAAAIIAISVVAGAQTQVRDQTRVVNTGSASVAGLVVSDDAARTPLRRATVTLSRANIEDIRNVATDDEGRYVFANLPAGSYALSASKGAYISMTYGAAKPGMPATALTLTEGQSFVAQPIALMRGAVIAGRVADRTGRPASPYTVEATQIITFNGERRRRSARGQFRTATNAHGEYRIYGLLPGEYIVSTMGSSLPAQGEPTAAELDWAGRQSGVAPTPSRTFMYAPTMYPGTVDASLAATITLDRGEERPGVDFILQYVPVARISGVAKGPDGRAALETAVACSLKTSNALMAAPPIAQSRPTADGAFSCAGLAPGRYLLTARGVPANMPPAMAEAIRAGSALIPLWGSAEVDVSGRDVADIPITLSAGLSVSGQVLSKGASALDPKRVQVRLLATDSGALLIGNPTAVPAADGTFQMDGVVPGTYRLVAAVAPTAAGTTSTWSLKSAMLGSADVADTPLTVAPNQNLSGLAITLSDAQAELGGSLRTASGLPAPQLYVFVFPTNKTMWVNGARRVRYVRSGENGGYVIPDLPPGDYFLSALAEFETALQYEPGYLEQLAATASKITIADGEKKRLDLQIGR